MTLNTQLKSDTLSKPGATPTLSLCMIVKNEEAFLRQCLESVKNVVDEMIIVDTGSTDRTVEIASEFTDKIYFHEWQGSFSDARNHALQFAAGDWILQMDADEALEPADIPLIRQAIQTEEADAIFVALLNDSKEGWSKHYFQRLYRRGRAHYAGIVHNQLVYEGPHLQTEIRIYHYGYNLSDEKMKAKYKRTAELLEKQIAGDPTNPFAHQNYIRVLRAWHRYEEAIAAGRQAFTVCRDRMSDINRQMIAYDLTYSLMITERRDEAETMCLDILRDFPDNLDFLFTYASVLEAQKRYEASLQAFHKFLEIREKQAANPKHTDLIVDTINFDHKAWGNISDCHYELENFEEALHAAEMAVQCRNDMPVYRVTRARVLVKMGQGERALSQLDEFEKTGKPNTDFYIRRGALCRRHPELGDPVEVLKRGHARFPDSVELRNGLAYALHPDRGDEAEKMWLDVLGADPDHVGARLGLVQLYARLNRTEDLKNQAEAVLKKTQLKHILKQVSSLTFQTGLYQTTIDLLSRYLTYEPNDADILADVATCYVKLGLYDAALTGYQAALQMNPGNERIIQNMKTLQKIINPRS